MQTRLKIRNQGRKAAILPLCVILLVLTHAGCGTFELNSLWRQNTVTIDGKTSDWLGLLTYIEDANISVGIINDEDYLYICLIAEDNFLQSQVIRQGLTLWLDPEGGKGKSFGIKFPLGMMAVRPPRDKSEAPEKRRIPRQDFDPSSRENLDITFKEMEILGPNEEILERIKLENIQGIEAQFKSGSGLMAYEIKIPLKATPDFIYAIRTQSGKTIGIGFETPKLDRANMSRETPSKMGRSGSIGGRDSMGGRGGRGGRSGMQPRMERLNVWILTILAMENNE